MSTTHYLEFPVSEEAIRELKMGDVVYLSGFVHTMRDMGHARSVEMLINGEKLPFDLASSCIWHAAPIVKQDESGKWHVLAAGSTTSSRFTNLGSDLLKRLGMRITIGKGTMGKKAVKTMREVGSVFLNTTGGCAAMYAQQVKDVSEVHWLDLGLPEAVWVLRVESIGPLIVGIDTHGNSLFPSVKANMDRNLEQQAKQLQVDLQKDYTYMPLRILGRPRE
jgi:hydro-lyases, Fe-S type, tartrate/fumarate subfamily, beta region